MALLILGLVILLGSHMIKSFVPDLRSRVIASGGKGLWIGLHAVTALVGLALVAYGYDQARATSGLLYNPPRFLSHITLLLMVFAFILLASAFLPAGRIRVAAKHPALLAVKVWALAHLLANGETNSVLLFVAFLAWAVMLRISMKRRARAGEITYPAFQSYSYDLMAVVIGLVVYVLFVWKLHLWLIGVAPIVMG